MITLYYNFNGLWDFEYNVDELSIIRAVYKVTGRIFNIKIIGTIFNRYQLEISRHFAKEAYNLYKQTDEFKNGIVELEESEENQASLKRLAKERQLYHTNSKSQENKQKSKDLKKIRYQQMKLDL